MTEAKKKETKPKAAPAKKSFKEMDMIRVTRLKSEEGLTDSQRATFTGLGLGRRHRTALLEDTNPVRGMVNKVINWVDVELIPAKDSRKAWEAMHQKSAKNKGYRVIES